MTTTARMSLIGRREGQNDVAITVEVGAPYQVGDDEWACPVSVQPLHERLRDQHGADSFQAMFLAVRLALTLLRGFVESGGILLMPGDDRADTGGDFPFEAYTINFVAGR